MQEYQLSGQVDLPAELVQLYQLTRQVDREAKLVRTEPVHQAGCPASQDGTDSPTSSAGILPTCRASSDLIHQLGKLEIPAATGISNWLMSTNGIISSVDQWNYFIG
ncbi:hypothetical protein PCANC_15235 [Puccinia coronata f. sp. avenae]|uniref:Uncharacterized protein n=1 Tax=Puccinia coronata f. sp. avenae TaxID=200324 RepID=A0A2N5VNL3_9BASI|nr:hypothetical protein PCANC_15235 [Puccinia coronata f. sp. avenae]